MSLFRLAQEEAVLSCEQMRRFPMVCVYCGDFATDKDHLLPEPWTGKAIRTITPTVPACSSCNTCIQDALEPRIAIRATLIGETLRARKRKLLKKMGTVDIEELEGNLKQKVQARRNECSHLLARLHILSIGGFAELEEDDRLAVLYEGPGAL